MIPTIGVPKVLLLRDAEEVRTVFREMGVSSGGIKIMGRKALFRVVRVSGLDTRAANILKQEMLSRGGEVATSREVYELGGKQAECLIMGTLSQYDQLIPKLKAQPFGLRALAEALGAVLQNSEDRPPHCHPGLDLTDRPLIMGAINVTPDSFSSYGEHEDPEVAVKAAWEMVEQGAHMIDVGGESTRPGSDRVSVEQELSRVLPVVEALAGALPVPVSVDTYKAQVAAGALEAGAFMINDVSGLRMDPEMLSVVRDAGCPVALMHMLGEPKTMQEDPVYRNVVEDVYSFFMERLETAVEGGLEEENLLLDVGIGFGKNLQHNLDLLRNMGTFRSLGRPLILGASRKRFIGEILGLSDPRDRVQGSAATTVMAALQGVDIVRVHDVRENAEAAALARAVYPPSGQE